MKTNEDRLRLREMKKRVRKIMMFRPSTEPYDEREFVHDQISIKLDSKGMITVRLQGRQIYAIRADDYVPLAARQDIDACLQQLRAVMVLDDLASL